MRKRVSSHEFLNNFARFYATMKPGESIIIMKDGKARGKFSKQSSRHSFQVPDFKRLGLEPRASEALYRKLMADIER